MSELFVVMSGDRRVKIRMLASGKGEYAKHQCAPSLPHDELMAIAHRAAGILDECRKSPSRRWELIANAEGFRFLNAASYIENSEFVEIEIYQEGALRDWYIFPDGRIISVTQGIDPRGNYIGPFFSYDAALMYSDGKY